MDKNDNDILERWEGLLSPAELNALRWITLDPTRPFCSKDLTELPQIHSKGTARNIIWKLKKHGLIELFCKSRYSFHKLKSVEHSKIKKPMTISRMGVNGLRRVQIDFTSLLNSLSFEELCKIHDVRLVFTVNGLYEILSKAGYCKKDLFSKDIFFGCFVWSKYRSLQVVLHVSGTVSFILDSSNCPIEASEEGFVSLAAFLGGIRDKLFTAVKSTKNDFTEDKIPFVDFWKVTMWHYGRDSAQEFSGEAFNITFKMWCGELARIYVHEQKESRKVRVEVIETPKKPLQQVIADKLNLCCGRCQGCLKQSS